MMKFIIEILKTSVVVAVAVLVLLLLAVYLPDFGIAAAIAAGALGLITLKWPIPHIWIENKLASISVIIVAVIGLVASAQSFAEHQRVSLAELKTKSEARLMELRTGNPIAYLAELKATNDSRWESEFEVLDKTGYEKFAADRRAKVEQERKDASAKLQNELKSVSANELESQQRILTKLVELEPNNRDFRSKLEIAEKQLNRQREAQALLEAQQKYPLRYVTIENFSWSKGGFGSVMIANFSIKNNLPWPIKDIEVQCTHSAPSGTTIDRNRRTIYERIEAGKIKRIASFSMGFVHSQA